MLTYILSALAVIIVSLCFFKDEFWENRYVVLFFIFIVSIISSVTTSYIIRHNLDVEVLKINKSELRTFYVNDSLINDIDFNFKEYEVMTLGSLESSAVNFVIFNHDNEPCIGYVDEDGDKKSYKLSQIHFVDGNEMVLMDVRESYVSNKWISGFSIPYKSKNLVVSIPSSELNGVDRSLINKLPFEL